MRQRLAIFVLVAFLAFTGFAAAIFGWYGYRVYTELTPGSWRSPTEILDRNGRTIVSLYGADWRVAEPVVIADLPKYIPNAFLAAEDTRFRSHIGIDPIGLGRAVVKDVAAGGVEEGGSTITQQLARTHFLSQERTVSRKFVEAGLALLIELRLTKDEILEAYLNEVYLGHRDGREVRGLGEASRVYFGKSPEKLDVAEAALIAGIIRAPNRDNPDERARIATQRRDAVLDVMLKKNWIDRSQHDEAVAEKADFEPGSRRLRPHPFLLAALRQEFIDRIVERALATGGMKIFTPVDLAMQNAAEAAVSNGTRRLRAAHGYLQRKKPLQGALLSVEPSTGGIRALVGGSNYSRSQFDRTRLMKRQPGSAAKPFTYAAAIASRRMTASTIIDDSPVQIYLASNKTWEPKNYDGQFRGPVTVREAFEKSLNVPAVKVATDVGVDRVQDMWHNAGIEGELSATPAIALGVNDVSMRELVSAYSIFPNLGARTEPHLIDRVETVKGDELYRYEVQRIEAIDPDVAFVMHSLMRGVVMRGTAASLNQDGLGYAAGKTGTTSNYRDAWFIGYTPDLLTGVWVGFDDGTPIRMSSGEAAVPIWAMYMSRAPHSNAEIQAPQGVSMVQVEAQTGRVWQPTCGPSVVEAYLSGTEPRDPCGGYFEGSQMMSIYEEPPMYSDQMAMPDYSSESEIVVDPADTMKAGDMEMDSSQDSVMFDKATVDTMRAREERRRRERGQAPPPPPIPPVDSVKKDSLRISIDSILINRPALRGFLPTHIISGPTLR